MMRHGDRGSLMKYAEEEKPIRKGQGFCFDGAQWVILNLTDDKTENDILRSFRGV